MKKVEVYESNAGCLALVVYNDNGKPEYIHTGYEFVPGQLLQDLVALGDGADPAKEWENNYLYDPDDDEFKEIDIEEEFGGWSLVADNDGIYPKKMGTAAKIEFGVERRYKE